MEIQDRGRGQLFHYCQSNELGYPAMPVMMKTPAHPVAVLPPKPGAAGGWNVECGDTGIWLDDAGGLQGFVLTGSATGRRNTLVKELAA